MKTSACFRIPYILNGKKRIRKSSNPTSGSQVWMPISQMKILKSLALSSSSSFQIFHTTPYYLSQPFNDSWIFPNCNRGQWFNQQIIGAKKFSSKRGTSGSNWWSSMLSPKNVLIHVVALAGGMTFFSVYKTRKNLYEAVPTDESILDGSKKNFIHFVDPEDSWAFLKQHFSWWWPVAFIARPIAWQLIEQIRHGLPEQRNEAIRRFARISNLLESECNHFSICLDLKTAIALARNGADPRLFIAPVLILPEANQKDYYGTKFRYIFSNLPSDQIHENLNTLIQAALKRYHPTEKDEEEKSLDYYTGFESDFHISQSPVKIMGEMDFLKICLQGIVSHSRVYERIQELISLGILDVLVSISRQYKSEPEIMSLVMKVLGNLTCDVSTAQAINETGCLKILAENMQNQNIKLSLPAKRALHNLDRETGAPILPPGVYQLYPDFGCEECSYKYDIVFIHGLLGGVFRTWRRKDVDPFIEISGSVKSGTEKAHDEQVHRVALWKSRLFDLRSKSPMQYNPTLLSNTDESVKYPCRKRDKEGNFYLSYDDVPLETEEVESNPTQCWPRDWLPEYFPKARIIAVDFQSFVTRWMNICPVENVERRLHDRGAELLRKLKDAGIGQRPVIWVTHSMGGLLLKSLLCQSDESDDKLVRGVSKNTKGIVFCSVPHHGTQMAILNSARKWLFLPTEEIEELANSGNQLTNLHECFKGLHDRYKFKVLSFAEILETRTGLGMKFKLVPYSSSDLGFGEYYPLRVDHLNTCKPWSKGSFMFKKTVELINEAISSQDAVVETSEEPIQQVITSFKLDFNVRDRVREVLESANYVFSSFQFFSKNESDKADESPTSEKIRVAAAENVTAGDVNSNKAMHQK